MRRTRRRRSSPSTGTAQASTATALQTSIEAGLDASRVYAFAEARGHFQRALALWDRVAPPEGSLPVDRVALLARAAQAARFAGEARSGDRALRGRAGPARPAPRPGPGGPALRAAGRVPLLGRRDGARAATAQALQLLPDGCCAGAGATASGGGTRADGHAPVGGVARLLRGRAGAWRPRWARRGWSSTRGARSRSCSSSSATPRPGERHFRQALDAADAPGRRRGGGARPSPARRAAPAARRPRRCAGRDGARGGGGGAPRHAQLVRQLHARQRRRRPAAARPLGRSRGTTRGGATARPRLDHRRAAPHGRGAPPCPAGRRRRRAGRTHPCGRRSSREGLPSEFGTPLRAAWAVLCLIAGEAEEAARHVAEALAALGETKEPLYTPVLYALGVRAEAERAALARTLRRRRRSGRGDRSRARPDRRPGPAARALARRQRRPPARRRTPRSARAELSRVEGASDPRRWEAVVQAWEALAEPHAAAYARLRLAEALLLAGRRPRGGGTRARGRPRGRGAARRRTAADRRRDARAPGAGRARSADAAAGARSATAQPISSG